MKILIAGGAGYIGSHTAVELSAAGHDVVIVDNLCNSSEEAVRRVQALSRTGSVSFVKGDVRDESILDRALEGVDGVMHFAALKAVGESVEQPLEYYSNNLDSTLSLLNATRRSNARRFVFSSSATVYGQPERIPIDESASIGSTNPYGRTKEFSEHILRDWCHACPDVTAVALRYFNPIGAHSSGRIGEDPLQIPNNLVPYVSQVAIGRRPFVRVYGNDYGTPDGTGVRDYIHVVDLAKAHVLAAEASLTTGFHPINVGTGNGYSVLEVIHEFERASGVEIPYQIEGRRAGDIDSIWADNSLAKEKLGWSPEFDLKRMCEDTWRWQVINPRGYGYMDESND